MLPSVHTSRLYHLNLFSLPFFPFPFPFPFLPTYLDAPPFPPSISNCLFFFSSPFPPSSLPVVPTFSTCPTSFQILSSPLPTCLFSATHPYLPFLHSLSSIPYSSLTSTRLLYLSTSAYLLFISPFFHYYLYTCPPIFIPLSPSPSLFYLHISPPTCLPPSFIPSSPLHLHNYLPATCLYLLPYTPPPPPLSLSRHKSAKQVTFIMSPTTQRKVSGVLCGRTNGKGV